MKQDSKNNVFTINGDIFTKKAMTTKELQDIITKVEEEYGLTFFTSIDNNKDLRKKVKAEDLKDIEF